MNKAFLKCDGYTHQHHGRGASQLGAYYYATEKGFDYTDIIDYYYHDYVSGKVNSSNEKYFSLFCNVNPELECYDPNYNS